MYKIKYIIGLITVPSLLLLELVNSGNLKNLHTSPSGTALLNYEKNINVLLDPKETDKNKISILAEKSKYKLTVYYEMKPVKSYPIVLGTNPVDDKLKEGDDCTPEGNFKVKASYKHSHWTKFIWLNYPTVDSWKKYSTAKKSGKLKLSDSIGGKIGIHGVPDAQDNLIDRRINWTAGSISLKNKDINELFEIVKDGTKVEIVH